MRFDLLPRVIVKLLLPFIPLFALYVQFHGEYGPGGGFQAGVITAGMVILYALVFGMEAAERIAPQALVERMIPLGVLTYASAGLPALFQGRNYLDYGILAADQANGHGWGIMIVEIGVLTTVSATMVAMFYAFVRRGRA
jgi:multicomponent Na+:H+ antiporter subunit B